jgi:class 3 adenylate cyclase
VLSEPTYLALKRPIECERLEPALVTGRHTPVAAYRLAADARHPIPVNKE